MITPQYLKKGDKIAIVATARKISWKEIAAAIKIFNSWGLETIVGSTVGADHHQFAGTDEQRLQDFQQMLDDPSVKAIICARGGYGTVRIIDKIDFSGFIKKPKWVVGYSDITVLHNHIHTHYNTETIHAIMPINFPPEGRDNESVESLRKTLFGEKIKYEFQPHPLNKEGTAEAILTGGNLSILYSLSGTTSDIDTHNKIFFIEDLDEYLYHIDRVMMNFKKSGKLHLIKALVVGGMTEMNDNTIPYGKNADEIIAEQVAQYDYPVCFNFPAGHTDDNRALILGRKAKLAIGKESCSIEFAEEQ